MKKKWLIILGAVVAGAVIGGLIYKKCTEDTCWDVDKDDFDENHIGFADIDEDDFEDFEDLDEELEDAESFDGSFDL